MARVGPARRLPKAAVGGLGLLVIAVVAFSLAGRAEAQTRHFVTDLMHLPLAALYCAYGLGARRRAGHSGAGRAWTFILVAFGCRFVAEVSWLVEDGVLGSPSYPAFADYWFLAFLPLMFAGLLLLPSARRSRIERIKLTLDALIVGAGTFIVLWYLLIGPSVVAADVPLTQTVFSVALPVGDLLLVLALAMVFLSRGDARDTAAGLLAAAVGAFVVADVAYGWMQLHEGFAGGMWPDLFWLTGDYLLVLAAHRTGRRECPRRDPRAGRLSTVSWLPYTAIALAYGLLGYQARRQGMYPLGGMILGAVALTALVVARQTFVLKENRELAVTDALTGLANRKLINDRIAAIGTQTPRAGRCSAVILVDLDKFKPINDTYGHEAGDAVLRATAVVLCSVIRAGDTAGRLGGDEFAVVLRDLPGRDEAERIARRLVDALCTPVVFGDTLLTVGASAGVAVHDASERISGERLLHRADVAMYAAKRAGRSDYRVYGPELDDDARATELRRAIVNGELELHYQPVVTLADGSILAVEALVRWNHPSRGRLLPAEFIAQAEQTGAVVALGEWVLRAACEQVARWRSEIPGAEAMLLCVNVSPRQIKQPDLVDLVTGILKETGLPAARLVLELPEGVVLEPDGPTVARLEALREAGVRIAVDDFGTGYSALSCLYRLPVSILKIDRTFVAGVADDPKARRVAEAVIALGVAFDLHVVVEGVETGRQAAVLAGMGCQYAQGFHFHRPAPAAQIAEVLLDGVERSLKTQ